MNRCQKCGDMMRHDDDGPTLCRWCSQCVPADGTAVSALEAIARNHSADPVLANVEQAVRDALRKN